MGVIVKAIPLEIPQYPVCKWKTISCAASGVDNELRAFICRITQYFQKPTSPSILAVKASTAASTSISTN